MLWLQLKHIQHTSFERAILGTGNIIATVACRQAATAGHQPIFAAVHSKLHTAGTPLFSALNLANLKPVAHAL